MRRVLFSFSVSLLVWLYQCTQPVQGATTYHITGELTGIVADSVRLFEYMGHELVFIKSAPIKKSSNEKESFNLSTAVGGPGVYLLTTSSDIKNPGGIPVILADEKKIHISAINTLSPATVKFHDAPVNEQHLKMLTSTEEIQTRIQRLQQEANQYMQFNPAEAQKRQKQVDTLNMVMANIYYSNTTQGNIVSKIAKLSLFANFDPQVKKYASEAQYFENEYLNEVDPTDPMMAYMPAAFNRIFDYTRTLMLKFGYNYNQIEGALNKYYAKIPNKSRFQEIFLLAAMNGAAASNQNQDFVDVYLTYAERYVQQYPNNPKAQECKQNLERYGKTRLGRLAPDIVQESPDGKEFKLSSLKGKVVLIDFWASWCGPCRRENPNVVKTYAQYNSKGFEIFSVSLDSQKDKWVQAIQQDNLTWKYHVSDLKGWQSAAAQLYGVTSIPSTMLLDREGKIIAKNLRGQALEQKLEEIFGKQN